MEMEWALPADLLLEITARSDIRTLVRCAALCKLLRRDVLDPSLIRRVIQDGVVPSCILAQLQMPAPVEEASPPPLLSLLHPAMPAAVSFTDDHLLPFMCRHTYDIAGDYYPVTSRGGLVLLRRRPHVRGNRPDLDLCVYDPITGHRTFLSEPPGIPYKSVTFHRYVLLTAADGIGCSFLLFVGDLNTSSPRAVIVQIFTSLTNTWGPVLTYVDLITIELWLEVRVDAVVLHGHGGVIHWLTYDGGKILTYDIRMAEPGMLEVPVLDPNFQGRQIYLGSYSSLDGRMLLRLLVIVGLTMSVWHRLPCGGWALETMTDMEEKLRSLDPGAPPDQPLEIWFRFSGERSNVVLLHMYTSTSLTILLDLETEEMHVTHSAPPPTLLEIDLPSRLRAMKIFS